MTDLREAYNLESFGDNAGCKTGECNCATRDGDCYDTSCGNPVGCMTSPYYKCADGSCSTDHGQGGSETACCPKVESFGNVRRPRKFRRREGFGNVCRPRRRERFGNTGCNRDMGGTCSPTLPACHAGYNCCDDGHGQGGTECCTTCS